jgi:hypothetical protein
MNKNAFIQIGRWCSLSALLAVVPYSASAADAVYDRLNIGKNHTLTGILSSIAGGSNNTATADYVTIGGGRDNSATGTRAFVGAGEDNQTSGTYAVIVGGYTNYQTDNYGFVGGGYGQLDKGFYGFIGGGYYNSQGSNSTGNKVPIANLIVGGASNTNTVEYSALVGGWANLITNQLCFLGGGFENIVGGTYGNELASGFHALCGGEYNQILGNEWAFLGGGVGNIVRTSLGTIGGGDYNDLTGLTATIAGGDSNVITNGDYSAVSGGSLNTISATYGTIGGGSDNGVSASYGTVPGGANASASHYGQMSYASGGFAALGDAQSSLFAARATTTNSTATELFLDGVGARMTIPTGQTWAYQLLVSARSTNGNSGGWKYEGLIKNVSGTTSMVGTPIKTVLGTNVYSWDATLSATTNSLVIKGTGDSTKVRWVASVRTSEVSQ